MNNWENLCKNTDMNLNEFKFHRAFGSYLETIFHWEKQDIQNELRATFGKNPEYADLVLEGNGFGIVIEFKSPKRELSEDDIEQLFGYMKNLGHKFGFLIGNKIKAIYDDDGKMVETKYWDYESNNPVGIKFGEIMDKAVCSSEALKDFIFSNKD
jgi:hypothetical protein